MKRVQNKKIEKIITTHLNNLKLVVNNNTVMYKSVKTVLNKKVEKIITTQFKKNLRLVVNNNIVRYKSCKKV